MANNNEPKFTREALVNSERYKDKTDLVMAVLEPERKYSFKQVDKAIEDYLKREVK